MNDLSAGLIGPEAFNHNQLHKDMFVNELSAEALGMSAINPFAKHNSPSRGVMFCSQFSQKLNIFGADEQICQSGVLKDFSKYTFSVKMPENGRIIRVLDRYPAGIGKDSIPMNPETIVIYEREDTKEIDYFSIPYHMSLHQVFGFRYSQKEASNRLREGEYIAKDTIFADSPAVTENGGYAFGKNLNVAFMSLPSTSEDGIMISKDVLPDLRFNLYETRVVEYGASTFPLNRFGNKDYYKPFPDIGDYLDDNGLLMMLRPYDEDMVPVATSIHDTREPDYIFDKAVYVRGGKGRVVDIKVITNNNKNKQLPPEIAEHSSKYEKALLKFHQEIINIEEKIRRERKKKFGDGSLRLSPRFHRLVVESLAVVDYNAAKAKHNLQLLYKKAPIDEVRVEFVIEYEVTPNIGFKMSGLDGDKGVICKIEEPENMPIDADGNRADVVMDDGSTMNRMNLGRLYQHYFNAAARDIRKEVRRILGVAQPKISDYHLQIMEPELINKAYSFLMGFYQLVSERQYQMYANELTDVEKMQHLLHVVNERITLFVPINNNQSTDEIVMAIEKYHRPTYGPVTYVGNSGRRVTTKRNVRIAPLYMMLLEKIADDWSSVASAKLQPFGVLAPTTKSEKYSYPFRNSPIRTIGETEGRIFRGYCGPVAIAEMHDRSNNPASQRHLYWNVMAADVPTDIDEVVDRNYISYGGGRPLQLIKHVMMAAGFQPVYEPENYNYNI